MATEAANPSWRPDREEAQFLGEVMNIDTGLAQIVRDQLVRGIPLRDVQATMRAALKIARTVQA